MIHETIANHNGDPECICGWQSPPANSVFTAASNTYKHVREANQADTLETVGTLFGNQSGERRNGYDVKVCLKCGSLVIFHQKHADWHNEVKGKK